MAPINVKELAVAVNMSVSSQVSVIFLICHVSFTVFLPKLSMLLTQRHQTAQLNSLVILLDPGHEAMVTRRQYWDEKFTAQSK